jgi:hypothetical protein
MATTIPEITFDPPDASTELDPSRTGAMGDTGLGLVRVMVTGVFSGSCSAALCSCELRFPVEQASIETDMAAPKNAYAPVRRAPSFPAMILSLVRDALDSRPPIEQIVPCRRTGNG